MRISRPLLGLLVASAVGCGGSAGDSSKPSGGTQPTTPVVTAVLVAPAYPNVELGATQTMTADVRDQLGAAISGKTATWSSSNAVVATIDATGLLHAVALGTSNITATVDGKSGTTTVTVIPPAVVSVTVAAPTSPLTAGQTVLLTATPKDHNGNVVPSRPVTWTSGAPRVATIDQTGLVTALSAGSATINALVDGIIGTATLVIAAPQGSVAPSISGISPATLLPGATATISGANFGATAALNQVYVSGAQATVTAASSTQLTITVPTTVPCQSTQGVNVDITTVAGTATQKQTLQIATQRALAVGASFLVTTGGNLACNELPTNGTYVVSVFNAAKSKDQAAGFELKGVSGGALGSMIANPDALRARILAAPRAPAQSAVSAAERTAAQEHLNHLASDLDLIRRLGPPKRFLRANRLSRSVIGAPGSPTPPSAAVVPLTVGANASINFHFSSCTVANATPVTARVVYVGTKAIVLEDNAAPLAGKIDADLIAMAKEYETTSFPLLANFGDPLAYDASLGNTGRITMLFTPQVNNLGANLLGFVSACDFYAPTDYPSVTASNKAEIFYARAVTDTSASSNSLNGRAQWKRQMPGTLIHETKHILAYGERFQTPIVVNAFEEVWLEEATAQMASEFYGRALHGNSWRSNSSYVGTLDCEVRPTSPSCGGGIFVMGNHFGFLTDFLQNFESKTILSGTDDYDIYGSAWLFARWLTDTYGGTNEASFIQSIVTNYNITGVDNVTAVTGKTWPELLSQYTLMLAADDLPGVALPYQEASWNLPGVFAGYNTDFPTSHPASPLTMRLANFGSNFTASVGSLKGGGAMLLRINGVAGSTTPQLLDLHDGSGTPLPSGTNIGMAVLRIQ